MANFQSRQEEWLYEVTGAAPREDAFVPDLTKVPKSWLTELPDWFGNVDQYSLVASNGDVSAGFKSDDAGRIAGFISNTDQCFINESGFCFTPPPIDEKEKFVYQGNIETIEGEYVPVSILAATKGHNFREDRDPYLLAKANQGFLDDKFQPLQTSHDIMAHQFAYGRYMNVPGGIAFVGALFPHVSKDMVARLNASAISGHWIYDRTDEKHIFAGAVFVNQPGFPLRSKANLQLREIAASLRYTHFMAEPVDSCTCKKMDVVAATDPNLQGVTSNSEEKRPELTIEQIDNILVEHTRQIAVLEQEVMKLIKAQSSTGDGNNG